jgi:hypothetical protein
LEQGAEEVRADRPRAARREEIAEARALPAEEPGQAQRGVERRARHAHVRVRGDKILLGLPHVRPPQEESRRQAPGHDRRHRLLRQPDAPRHGPGRAPEKERDLVLTRHDALLEDGNLGRRVREESLQWVNCP